MAVADDAREREQRRWDAYQPPSPGSAQPEPAASPREWSAYSVTRARPVLPGRPSPPPPRRRTAQRASAVAFGLPFVLIVALNVVGSLTEDEDPRSGDPITYVQPPEADDAVGFGPDPRTAVGLDVLVDALVAENGDAWVTWARLTADTATVVVAGDGGEVRAYRWAGTWEGVLVDVDPPATRRDGAPFDLARVEADAFEPLLARVQGQLGIGPEDPEVILEHLPGSRAWVTVTGVGATHTGVYRATADGTLLEEAVEPYR